MAPLKNPFGAQQIFQNALDALRLVSVFRLLLMVIGRKE
jgi:hypothetical protein